MNNLIPRTTLAGVLCLLGACTTVGPSIALSPVGPEPESVRVRRESPEGSLVVYSAMESQRQSCCDDYVEQRSGYDVLTSTGSPFKHVGSPGGESPQIVFLAPGHYIVRAQATGSKLVDVPVLIVRADTTVVHLDGSPLAGQSLGATEEIVRLPDGSIVGWREKGTADNHGQQ